MKNPIKRILEEEGLTVGDLADLAGVGYSTAYSLTAGHTNSVNDNVLEALDNIGHDPAEVTAQYSQYKEWKQEQVLEQVS